jgi:hypothetical protein
MNPEGMAAWFYMRAARYQGVEANPERDACLAGRCA